MSETYECVVDLATETLTAVPSAMLRQRAVVEMERDVVMRRVHGVVRRVEDLGTTAVTFRSVQPVMLRSSERFEIAATSRFPENL